MGRLKLFILIFLGLVITRNICGQTSFNLEAFSYSGSEHNIYKSPDVLYDLSVNEYIDKNALIISDNFVNLGYDARFRKFKRKRYKFEIGSDLQYKRFFNYSNVNNNNLSVYSLYEKNIGKKAIAGIEYDFSWTDKLGVSISGDDLVRSFKYISNSVDLYLELEPNKKIDMELLGGYQYKYFYDDTTEMPLDFINLQAGYILTYKINRKNAVELDLEFKNRQYKYYPASNSRGVKTIDYDNSGNVLTGYSLRHFQYYSFNMAYEMRPSKTFKVSPGFEYTRRNDTFEDYYSYSSYMPMVKIRYDNKKWYAYGSFGYKQVHYDKRFAHTEIINSDLLIYDYIKAYVIIKYKVANRTEILLSFNANNRYSNTELEHARTRRPYTNYEALLGLNFQVFDN